MRTAPDWTLVRPPSAEAARARRLALLLLAFAAVVLTINLTLFPIYPWDEARLAINAMEMRHAGLSLVTTYHFRPDLWNTKPPLLIWLMDASMAVFGAHAWAIRLPSALATVASLAVTMALTWRMTRTAFPTLAAGLLLFASRGFSGQHAGQTADYDALLCLFTTGYSALLFLTLSRRRPKAWPVLAAGVLIGGAVLTKGIAGLVPGAGLVLYLIWTRRLARPFVSVWYWLTGALALAIAGGFYGVREAIGPGYLKAVWVNEIGGRYGGTIQGHDRWAGYYLVQAFAVAGFSLGPFALPALWPVRWLSGRRRALARFCLCMALALFVVLSLGGTKIRWYLAPAYPFLAMACALGIEAAAARLFRRTEAAAGRPVAAQQRRTLVAVGIALMIVEYFAGCYLYPWGGEHKPRARYGQVFAALKTQGVRRVGVVDSGLENSENIQDYAPQADFYSLIWSERGLDIRRVPASLPVAAPVGEVLASCDDQVVDRLARLGPPVADVPGCVAIRLARRRD